MDVVAFVLMVFAFVCFVIGAFGPPTRHNIVAAGLAFLAASLLAGAWPIG
jgi:hypothetical protein